MIKSDQDVMEGRLLSGSFQRREADGGVHMFEWCGDWPNINEMVWGGSLTVQD